MISPIASATAALSSTIGNAIDCDEPTARNSNLLPVNANGDVRLRSVLSFSISGSLRDAELDHRLLGARRRLARWRSRR